MSTKQLHTFPYDLTEEEAKLVLAWRKIKEEVEIDPKAILRSLPRHMMELTQSEDEHFQVSQEGVFSIYVWYLLSFEMVFSTLDQISKHDNQD